MTVMTERRFGVSDGAAVLECFEATAGRVFAALCHLTLGDLHAAEELLERTYLYVQEAGPHVHGGIDETWILIAAHRIYVDEQAGDQTGQTTVDGATTGGATGGEPPGPALDEAIEWAHPYWGESWAALARLTAHQRAALSLHDVEHTPLDDVARCLRLTDFDLAPILLRAQQAVLAAAPGESIGDAFRPTEVWLDDVVREKVRVSVIEHETPPGKDEADARRALILKVIAAFAAGVLVFLVVRWIATAPDDEGQAVEFSVPAGAEPSGGGLEPSEGSSGPVRTTGDRQSGTYTMVLPVLGSTGESVTYLAPNLSHFEEVAPDMIVRYANGKIGLVWHGACNRPASTVQIVNLPEGVGLRLVTGAFPAVACTGMPDRWTAVIQPTIALDDGPIYPLTGAATLDTSYDGYVDDPRSVVISSIGIDDADFGSALVDQANQPWIYGAGCSSKVTRYRSRFGPIFEVRLNLHETEVLSAGDEVICDRLASRQVLYSETGAQWPRRDTEPGSQPRDCNGPFKSLVDVPAERPYTTAFYDGDWATWDGCLVNSRVINSRRLSADCGWSGVRIITFNERIGRRIGPRATTVMYVRDPSGVLPDSPDQLRHYISPPDEIYDTGLRFGLDQLWLPTEGDDAIYIRRGGDIERWPKIETVPSCR